MLNKNLLTAFALAGAILVPGTALAASAIATTDVNLRAGPSTSYPPVNVVAGGDEVEVFGCLSNRSWCDVDYYGQRGWMSSNYLAYLGGGQRYTGPVVVERIGAPVVSFSFGTYWDDHYRSRPFYRDRARYDGVYGRPIYRDDIRRDRREDRREFRRERREDFREDRRDFRAERRDDLREIRRELRDDRRGDRRDDRREIRRERREDRREDRRDY